VSGFGSVLEAAIAAVRDDILNGRFEVESERDLQAMIYYHARLTASQRGLPDNQVHAEPQKVAKGISYVYPDLVLGNDEVFVELKFIRSGASGAQMKLKGWKEDAGKLHDYKQRWPNARCIFFAVDEAHHHSNPAHKDYFDPQAHGLQGAWQPFWIEAESSTRKFSSVRTRPTCGKSSGSKPVRVYSPSGASPHEVTSQRPNRNPDCPLQ
jgi:hypothetical protein